MEDAVDDWDPTGDRVEIHVGFVVRVAVEVRVDVSVVHADLVAVPVRVDVLDAVAVIVGRIPSEVPSATMLKKVINRSILAYQADRQKVFTWDPLYRSIAWVSEWLRRTTQDRLELFRMGSNPISRISCGWPRG